MKIILRDVDKLKELVLRSGYTVRSFGREIEISSAYISQICNGSRNPGPLIAKKITDKLSVEFDSIFFIEDGCKSDQTKTA